MSKELLSKLEGFQGSEIKESEKIKGGKMAMDVCVTCTPEGNRTDDAD